MRTKAVSAFKKIIFNLLHSFGDVLDCDIEITKYFNANLCTRVELLVLKKLERKIQGLQTIIRYSCSHFCASP